MPMLDDFGDQRPELRVPKDTDGGPVCPRCDVPVSAYDVGFVEVPVDRFEFELLTEKCKDSGTDYVRTRGWVCPTHGRDVHLLRTVETLLADGWNESCGVRVELDNGESAKVPVLYSDIPREMEYAIRDALGMEDNS